MLEQGSIEISNLNVITWIFKEVKDIVNEGLRKGYIDEKMHKTLLPPKAQSSKLYLLPKVHKQFEGFPKCETSV